MLPGPPPQPLRILVASGDLLLTRRIASALAEDSRTSLVGTAASADEAVALTAELLPDLIFVDESLPPAGPLAAIEAVTGVSEARVILLVDELPEIDWHSDAARRIVAFASRDRPAGEIAAAAYEVAMLALALAPPAELVVGVRQRRRGRGDEPSSSRQSGF